MSTDFSGVCTHCKTYTNLGQRFTSGAALGYGTRDEEGRRFAAEFVSEYVYHSLVVVVSDAVPEDYTELDDEEEEIEITEAGRKLLRRLD